MSIYEGFRVNGDVALFFWFCFVVDVDYALAFGKIEHADVIVIGNALEEDVTILNEIMFELREWQRD